MNKRRVLSFGVLYRKRGNFPHVFFIRAAYKRRAQKSTSNFPSISPAESHDLETSHQGLFIFKITARKDLAFLRRQISPEDFIATF